MRSSGFSYSRVKTSPEKALQKLRHYCGYQERSHAEVKQKLYSLGFFEKEAEENGVRSPSAESGFLQNLDERFRLRRVFQVGLCAPPLVFGEDAADESKSKQARSQIPKGRAC